jgi:predicted aspartyl protease
MLRLLVALLLVLGASGLASAELYRWTDENGISHYTSDVESIPPNLRASVTVSSPPRSPDGPPQRPAADPTVVPYAAGGPLIVTATLNGVPIRLLVDTGADRTIISAAAASRAGLTGVLGAPVHLMGVGGRVTGVEVVVPTLDLAGSRIGNFPVIIHDTGVRDADGLLGRDVLDAFTLTVDAAGSRATIVPR